MIADIDWRNHGTAVLGEMISVSNSKGCVGISHAAKAVVHSAVINGVFNAAQALTNATSQLKAGDGICPILRRRMDQSLISTRQISLHVLNIPVYDRRHRARRSYG
jgi:hypothetical protein